MGVKESLWHSFNKHPQQFVGVCVDGFTDLDKFYDVDPPFAPFVFGDERLRLMKAFGEFVLGEAGFLARPIIKSQKAACPAEWIDLSSLRARLAIGGS